MVDAVRSVKAEMGVRDDNSANRMVARKMLLNKLGDRGMRPSHIHSVIEVGVELVFTPTLYDIEAAAFRTSEVRSERIARFKFFGGRFPSGGA